MDAEDGKDVKYPYEYDAEKRRISKIYMRTQLINGVLNSIVISTLFLVFMIFSGASIWLRDFAVSVAGDYYLPLFIFIFMTIDVLVSLPLSFYSGFIYEHKWGLSNQTFRAWMTDFLKGMFLSYLITVPLLSGLYILIARTEMWYAYATVLYIAFMLFMDYIYPIVIFPFFYKTHELPDGALKKRIFEILGAAGVTDVKRVEVAEESEKSVRANAMFAGIGSSKRIILYDNLLAKFHPLEVETVVAHELGHRVNRDVIRFTVIDVVKILPVFLLVVVVFDAYGGQLGFSGVSDIAGLPLLMLVSSVFELMLMAPEAWYSRKRETLADRFALEATGLVEAQVSCEKRLVDMNLGDDSPNRWVEFFLFSHPSAKKRIEFALEWGRKNKGKSVDKYSNPIDLSLTGNQLD